MESRYFLRSTGHSQTIRSSGESLLSIINDILDYSKVESGKMELEEVDFNLVTLVEEAVAVVAHSAHAKGLELTSPICPSVPHFVRGDSKRLRQVLLNLLGNAIKFTQEGDVILQVKAESLDSESTMLRFEIRDTGIGIPEHVRMRIFEPFTQADSSTTRRFGGTGLGLAICRQLVNLMGGEIAVESDPGRGSTFWFTARFGIAAAQEARADEGNAVLIDRRVLVVDDNGTNRKLLGRLLGSYGMQVTPAEDGMHALKLLLQALKDDRPFDLALLDLQMPLMDGIMLARAIRAQQEFQSLPLVLLTSTSGAESTPGFAGLRIHSIQPKPIRRIPLLQVVRTALGGVQAEPAHLTRMVQPAGPWRGHILLAEDNPVNQKVCGVFLNRLGYTYDVVMNGLEALQAIQNSAYHAVLLDCQMPEMDGFEAARAIRKLESGAERIPLIALTANVLSGERERCLEAGMDDYLAKPIRPEALGSTLQSWLAPRAA